MQSQVADELQVSDDGLHAEAGWCHCLAEKLAGDSAPTGGGLSWLASGAAVNAANAQMAAANMRCTFRVQATAATLVAADTSYVENEAGSATQFRAIAIRMGC